MVAYPLSRVSDGCIPSLTLLGPTHSAKASQKCSHCHSKIAQHTIFHSPRVSCSSSRWTRTLKSPPLKLAARVTPCGPAIVIHISQRCPLKFQTGYHPQQSPKQNHLIQPYQRYLYINSDLHINHSCVTTPVQQAKHAANPDQFHLSMNFVSTAKSGRAVATPTHVNHNCISTATREAAVVATKTIVNTWITTATSNDENIFGNSLPAKAVYQPQPTSKQRGYSTTCMDRRNKRCCPIAPRSAKRGLVH